MWSILYVFIGLVASRTLESGGITDNMWQHWVILACIVASVLLTSLLW